MSFCYEDEEERTRAKTASLAESDCICWAETVWASTEKRRALQWDGYVGGWEVGFVSVDLDHGGFCAYTSGIVPYRTVGQFRGLTNAKQAVMCEVVEIPLALCEAFEALNRFRVWAREHIAFHEKVRQFNALHHARTRASITG